MTVTALGTRPRTRHTALPSLVVTPAVVAHRGASGHRPEHTLAAYRTAIRAGVDDIELDLVATRDHVLVARHDLELSRTTDVADHPELAHLRRTRSIDGTTYDGWFAQDLTLAELKRLTARERWPLMRPGSAAYDGTEGVPTLTEVLAMAGAEGARRGRTVGVMCELKHAAHHDRAGLPLEEPLLDDLRRHGLDQPWARVTLMAFESEVLRRLATRTRLPVVQLLDRPVTAEELAAIDEYADGIGAHTSLVLPRDDTGATGAPSTLVREAHGRWLTVHAWTVRAENRHLPTDLRRGEDPDAHGDMAAHVRALLDAGVDGVITDHPDVALSVRPEVAATPGARSAWS